MACVIVQKQVNGYKPPSFYEPNPNGVFETSKEALEALLSSGKEISDIAESRSISNCIPFNSKNIQDTVTSRKVDQARREVDQIIKERIQELFRDSKKLEVRNSGHFWYPPGGYMGWHTNQRGPGWRLYINLAEEPNKSYFRYRDPGTGEIITAMDRRWNFRLFRIDRKHPLWHAIYSDTNRFSIGYIIYPKPSLLTRITRPVLKLLRTAASA